MGIIGVNCCRGLIRMDEHLECMQHADHPCTYSEDTLMAMTDSNKERVQSGVKFSPSSLQGCQRQATLQGQADYYLNVDESWPLFRGNLAHALYETLPPWPGILGTIREYRFQTEIITKYGPECMMGKPDLIVLKRVDYQGLHIRVVDYKSKSEIGHDLVAADPKHVNQVNIYAWIAAQELRNFLRMDAGVTEGEPLTKTDDWRDLQLWVSTDLPVIIDELEIIYIDMKKSRRFISNHTLTTKGKMTKRTYPKEYETLELAPIPIKKPSSIENWLRVRIERYLRTEQSGSLAAPITGDDSWVCARCPVLSTCIDIGQKEGHGMEDQLHYDRS